MATVALDASLQTLRQSVTDRLADEDRFKREVYNKINQILARLNTCATSLLSSSGPVRAAAAVDLTAQVALLNAEVTRLQNNRLTGIDSDYVTQPLRAEANNDNLKWDTDASRIGFTPPPYASSPGPGSSGGPGSGGPGLGARSSSSPFGPSTSSVTPGVPGASSSPSSWGGPFAGFTFGSSPTSSSSPLGSSNRPRSSTSLFDDEVETPLRPLTGAPRPARLDPNLTASDPFASAIGHSSGSAEETHGRFGGWSPKRKTPKRTPRKKTYRR